MGGCRPVGGGDRRDGGRRHAVPRGPREHRFGKAMPGGVAAAGGMEDAAEAVLPPIRQPIGDGEDGGGEVGGGGRTAALVGDHAQPAGFARGIEHGQHEILAGRRIDPGGAQHDGMGARCKHRLLAGQLARAIDAHGTGRVGLDIGRALQPVEDIVGGDVDEGTPWPAHHAAMAAGPSRLARHAASASVSALSTAV